MSNRNQEEAVARSEARFATEYTAGAGTIRQRYPDVEVIELQLRFPNGSVSQHTRRPKHSALFHVDCPNVRCIDGGFDLDPPVHRMLRNREYRAEGSLQCQGRMRSTRSRHRARCDFEVRYVMWAEYVREDAHRRPG